MDKDKLTFLNFYKELDQQEIKLKEEYDKMVSFPITALSAMIAGAYFLVNRISSVVKLNDLFSYYLFVVFACFFVCWLISSYYFINFIHGFKRRIYKVFPKADELSHYQDQLIDYLKGSAKEDKMEKDFERSFQNYILETYIDQATYNACLNEERQELYHSFKKYIIICFYILVFISISCFFKIIFP